jgi:hypothetical protein
MLLSAGRLLLSAGFFLPEGERDGCGVGELRGFAEEAGAATPGDCAGDGGAWVSLGEGAGEAEGLAERHTELNAVGGGGGCVAPLSPLPQLQPSTPPPCTVVDAAPLPDQTHPPEPFPRQ